MASFWASFWRKRTAGWLRELGLYLAGSVQSHRRQAEALASLDDRLLRDVGVSPAQARIGSRIKARGQGNRPLPGSEKRSDFDHIRG
jgi:uncharacterized protein YjiS (DUF1127 family)